MDRPADVQHYTVLVMLDIKVLPIDEIPSAGYTMNLSYYNLLPGFHIESQLPWVNGYVVSIS